MSGKFAGFTPYGEPAYATTSRVDITNPAPFPMVPTELSSLT